MFSRRGFFSKAAAFLGLSLIAPVAAMSERRSAGNSMVIDAEVARRICLIVEIQSMERELVELGRHDPNLTVSKLREITEKNLKAAELRLAHLQGESKRWHQWHEFSPNKVSKLLPKAARISEQLS